MNDAQNVPVIQQTVMPDTRELGVLDLTQNIQVAILSNGDKVFFMVSTASSAMVMQRYFTDPESPSGWSNTAIPLPDTSYIQHITAVDSNGNPLLFIMTGDSTQIGVVQNAHIYQLEILSDGSTGNMTKLADTQINGMNSLLYSQTGPSVLWAAFSSEESVNYIQGLTGPNLAEAVTGGDGGGSLMPISAPFVEIVEPLAVWPTIVLASTDSTTYPGYNFLTVISGQSYSNGILVLNSDTSVSLPHPSTQYSLCSVSTTKDDTIGNVRIIIVTGIEGWVSAICGLSGSGDGQYEWFPNGYDLITSSGTPNSGVNQISATVNSDNTVTLLYACGTSSSAQLNIIEINPYGNPPMCLEAWSQPINLAPNLAGSSNLFLDDEGWPAIAFIAADVRQLRVLSRDENEDWQIEKICAPGDTTIGPANVYRLSVTAMDPSGTPYALSNVAISADDQIYINVNGGLQYVSTNATVQTTTDPLGSINIMVDISESIAVPALTLTSSDGIFGSNSVVIRPEANAQKMITSASPEVLQQAQDFDGMPLLPADTDYAAISSSLQQLGSTVAHIYERNGSTSGTQSDLPYGVWLVPYGTPANSAVPRGAGTWALTKDSNGAVSFEILSSEEASARRAAIIERARLRRPDSADNIFDDFVDTMTSITDVIVSTGQVIIDGVSATIELVVDGISRAITAALDGISKVMDCVKAVLNFAGAVLGRVVGWIIRAIGWLLGFPDLVKIKNYIKNAASAAITGITQAFPDPATQASYLHQEIQTYKAEFVSLIQNFESTPASSTSFSGLFGPLSSVVGIFSGSANISTQTSWFIDKLLSALPSFTGGMPKSPDMGIQPILFDLVSNLQSMQTNVESFAQDAGVAVGQTWVDSFGSFDSSTFDPLLQVLLNHGCGLLDNLDGCVDDLSSIMHAFWANPGALNNWLDESFDIPFFSSFYAGLVGNDLSVLDLVCMVSSIPLSILAPPDVIARIKTGYASDNWNNEFVYLLSSVMFTRAFFVAIAAAGQNQRGAEVTATTEVAVYMALCSDFLIGVLGAVYGNQFQKEPMIITSTIKMLTVAINFGTVFARDLGSVNAARVTGTGRDMVAILGQVLSTILNSILMGNSGKWIGYFFLNIAQPVVHALVDYGIINVSSPRARAMNAAIQGGCTATAAGVFMGVNLNGISSQEADKEKPQGN